MINMDLKVQIADAKQGLLDLGVDLKTAITSILTALATAGRKQARANMYGRIGGGARWLERHIYGRRRSTTHSVVSAPRHIAEILEKGGTINARKKKYLMFEINGQWKKVKRVTIPAKKWFSAAMEGFEESNVYGAAIDKGVATAIRKFNKRTGASL